MTALTIDRPGVGLDPLRDITHREARAARELADWLAGLELVPMATRTPVPGANWSPKASMAQCVLSHVSDQGRLLGSCDPERYGWQGVMQCPHGCVTQCERQRREESA